MKLTSITFKKTETLTHKFSYICIIKKSFLAAASVNKGSKKLVLRLAFFVYI